MTKLTGATWSALGRLWTIIPQACADPQWAWCWQRDCWWCGRREGRPSKLKANRVQRAFENKRGQRNIVLKARQMGLTTWVAARFFLKTITQPGTLTLEVAHTQEAAEEIFRIVHRFLDWLPDRLREGPLKTSRANVRQIVFPEMDAQYRVVSAADRNAGRGLTVQNLHCSELARWPGDAAETWRGCARRWRRAGS